MDRLRMHRACAAIHQGVSSFRDERLGQVVRLPSEGAGRQAATGTGSRGSPSLVSRLDERVAYAAQHPRPTGAGGTSSEGSTGVGVFRPAHLRTGSDRGRCTSCATARIQARETRRWGGHHAGTVISGSEIGADHQGQLRHPLGGGSFVSSSRDLGRFVRITEPLACERAHRVRRLRRPL